MERCVCIRFFMSWKERNFNIGLVLKERYLFLFWSKIIWVEKEIYCDEEMEGRKFIKIGYSFLI